MALSNILNEPRREITESAVGIVAVAIPIFADYRFGVWFRSVSDPRDSSMIVLGMLIGVAGLLALLILIFATHAIGDQICNAAQKRGLVLRPRERYGADGRTKYESIVDAKRAARGGSVLFCNPCQAYHIAEV